ncbi:MAG: tRNA (5-methylaminomethyl-2-thiouridylate)-methyltransferase [Pseudomonadota bacterium]
MKHRAKAVALISGGLDSLLAARVVMDQGVYVEGLNFFTGFCVEGHTHAIRSSKAAAPRNNALWVAEQLGIKLHIVDVIDDYKDVLLKPRHGYGKNLNPCLDCKVFMVNRAAAWGYAEERGFDFVITGEVMGQRPKSQMKSKLGLIASESGVDDRLLRPLSARLLPETLPEREGWVDREALHGFHGRNRKPQIALARQYGYSDWAQPAGGCCFLTDPEYSNRLGDLWNARGSRDYELDDIVLLKVGRHLRPAPHYKLVIARDAGESNYLQGYRRRFTALDPISHRGPIALIDGDLAPGDAETAARLFARYTQGRAEAEVTVRITGPEHNGVGEVTQVTVAPMAAPDIPASWHV